MDRVLYEELPLNQKPKCFEKLIYQIKTVLLSDIYVHLLIRK